MVGWVEGGDRWGGWCVGFCGVGDDCGDKSGFGGRGGSVGMVF